MKRLLPLLFILPLLSYSQDTLEKKLDSVSSIDEANTFAKTHKKANKSKVYIFNKEKHKTRLANDLFKLSEGGKKVVKSDNNKTYYKVIAKERKLHYKVSYIFLDGKKMTKEAINTKRSKIISQYKQGYKFEALAQLHSMDPNAKRGGDLGWFPEGRMHPDFENAIASQQVGDIFTLDIDDRKWHYVILKTHDQKEIEEITVLKFSENND